LFNGSGYVTGLNTDMIKDLNDMLKRANNHKIMVILTLWDFEMYKTQAVGLLKDDSKLDSYLNNALIPLINGINN
jgi:hypothetical protein